ncbi:MAG: hypothetical protein ACRDVL_03340 [Acidimicrobiia bacterium]
MFADGDEKLLGDASLGEEVLLRLVVPLQLLENGVGLGSALVLADLDVEALLDSRGEDDPLDFDPQELGERHLTDGLLFGVDVGLHLADGDVGSVDGGRHLAGGPATGGEGEGGHGDSRYQLLHEKILIRRGWAANGRYGRVLGEGPSLHSRRPRAQIWPLQP